MQSTLITCYVNPDLDGVAGAFAYAEFLQKTGVKAEARIIGKAHDEAEYIINRFDLPYPESILNADNYDQVVLVDASDLNGLGGKISPEKVIEIIDHRKVHEADKFPKAKVQIELVGAAATLIAEKFMENNIEVSRESAILLYGAIISNTLNFKGTVTTDRDRRAAQYLLQKTKIPNAHNFWRELFMAKSDLSGSKLQDRIKDDTACFVIGEKKISIAQLEIIGAKKLIDEREAEIIQVLNDLKKELNLDYVFQNTLELEDDKNFFVTDHKETKILLEKVLNVKFKGNVAERAGLILRKEITPLLINNNLR
jgi:manganese-dependent inorganic pyrophosphatase